MPKLRFLRSGIEIEVPAGSNLRQAALKHGVRLYPGIHRLANCHGLGQCGSCRVLLKEGSEKNASPKGIVERMRLAMSYFAIGHGDTMRLACQTKVMGDLEVLERPPGNVSGVYGPEAERARKRLRQGKY